MSEFHLKYVGRRFAHVADSQYGVQILGIKELVPERLNRIPTGGYVVKDSDILILPGSKKGLDLLRKKES